MTYDRAVFQQPRSPKRNLDEKSSSGKEMARITQQQNTKFSDSRVKTFWQEQRTFERNLERFVVQIGSGGTDMKESSP